MTISNLAMLFCSTMIFVLENIFYVNSWRFLFAYMYTFDMSIDRKCHIILRNSDKMCKHISSVLSRETICVHLIINLLAAPQWIVVAVLSRDLHIRIKRNIHIRYCVNDIFVNLFLLSLTHTKETNWYHKYFRLPCRLYSMLIK